MVKGNRNIKLKRGKCRVCLDVAVLSYIHNQFGEVCEDCEAYIKCKSPKSVRKRRFYFEIIKNQRRLDQ